MIDVINMINGTGVGELPNTMSQLYWLKNVGQAVSKSIVTLIVLYILSHPFDCFLAHRNIATITIQNIPYTEYKCVTAMLPWHLPLW